jgi:WS/DGAT/MGAT family acyltransferase
MWRCERDPALRPALVAIVLLDRPPDPRRFLAGHEWASRMVPRLRERLVAPPLTPTLPVWSPDPEFDPARHLRRAALPGPGGLRELFDLAGHLAAAPFDPNRPPWESTLVEDFGGGPEPCRAAWLVRFHHCLADGPLVGFWLSRLLSRTRAPRADKPQPPAAPRWLDPPIGEQLAGPLVRELAPAARRIASGASAAARSPVKTSREISAMAYRLLEVTTRPAAKPSPLLRARGANRRFEGLDLELGRLRAAARAAGVPVNAVYCSGLFAGLRRYHEAHGVAVPSIPAAITLPVDRAGPRGGNRFNGGKFPGPLDEPDPKALVRAVGRLLAGAAPPFPPAALDPVLGLVNRLPDRALMPMARSLGRSSDIQISHVVMPGREAYVSGARVEGVWGFGPAPGCALMALLVTRGARSTLGLTLDTAAVPDPGVLVSCLEQGFADVLGVGAGPPARAGGPVDPIPR